MKLRNLFNWLFLCSIILGTISCEKTTKAEDEPISGISVGVYYFDGWAGLSSKANDPNEPWAKTAPTHMTRRMVEEFPMREPIWGWRDDSLSIMERQIDLAADNGVKFFLFCWYWQTTKGPINSNAIENDSKQNSLKLFLKAKNRHRIKYSLLIANHSGAEIVGTYNWTQAARYWMQYFQDPQYFRIDNKPLLVIFDQKGTTAEGLVAMQDVAKSGNLPGLSIAGCNTTSTNTGFTHRTHYNIVPGYSAGSAEHPYSEIVTATKKQWFGSLTQPYIPVLESGWDKRPWEGPTGLGQVEGYYYPDRTPAQFRSFLQDAVDWMDLYPAQTTKERVVLVYAWNELGEGGYLVPTKGDPDASYLKEIKSVVDQNK